MASSSVSSAPVVMDPRSITCALLAPPPRPESSARPLRPASEVLAGKVVGYYFSASWCPPCRAFTPTLKEAYASLRARGAAFEVVFVSSDRDAASFEAYAAKMPWAAAPFSPQGAALRARLAEAFGVRSIPRLVLVDEHGHVINADARGAVMRDPKAERFPWPGEVSATGGMENNTAGLLRLLLLFLVCWLLSKWFTGNSA